jgi:hypothetical protein
MSAGLALRIFGRAGGVTSVSNTVVRPLGHIRWFSPCTLALSDKSNVPDKEGSSMGGDTHLVDPLKDGTLQDLFVIPVKKPLIPGASTCYLPARNMSRSSVAVSYC